MLYSLFTVSAALLSFSTLTQAIPQGAIEGQSTTSTTVQASSTTSQAISASTIACNNSPLLCNRSYNNITYMGAHDSAFLRDSTTGFSTSGNQYYNATVALSAGIRLLQAQVHNEDGVLQLCHSSCLLLNGGTLEKWLSEIKTWLDTNPNEVITILLVNSDDVSGDTIGEIFTSSGISMYGYIPSTNSGPLSAWPTLQTLISANTRLVTFIASIDATTTHPYLLPEFDYVFETAFGVTSLSGFNCSLSRPSTLSSAATAVGDGYLGLLNHFKDTDAGFGILIPDVANLTITNSPSLSTAVNNTGSLGLHGQQCAEEWGSKPSFILVDFWNVGPSLQVADYLNGIVTPVGREVVGTEELDASSSAAVGGWRRGRGVWGLAAGAMGVLAVGNLVWL